MSLRAETRGNLQLLDSKRSIRFPGVLRSVGHGLLDPQTPRPVRHNRLAIQQVEGEPVKPVPVEGHALEDGPVGVEIPVQLTGVLVELPWRHLPRPEYDVAVP